MRQIRIQSLKNQSVIAEKCFVAERFFDRLRGLIGRRALETGEAMLFPQCNDIHTWFMNMPIDVVFLKPKGPGAYVVTSVRENVRPWRILPLRDGKAADTLELAAGAIRRLGLRAGDEVCIS